MMTGSKVWGDELRDKEITLLLSSNNAASLFRANPHSSRHHCGGSKESLKQRTGVPGRSSDNLGRREMVGTRNLDSERSEL